jgi:hypothetical protein
VLIENIDSELFKLDAVINGPFGVIKRMKCLVFPSVITFAQFYEDILCFKSNAALLVALLLQLLQLNQIFSIIQTNVFV